MVGHDVFWIHKIERQLRKIETSFTERTCFPAPGIFHLSATESAIHSTLLWHDLSPVGG
jgi:hypothetical protein